MTKGFILIVSTACIRSAPTLGQRSLFNMARQFYPALVSFADVQVRSLAYPPTALEAGPLVVAHPSSKLNAAPSVLAVPITQEFTSLSAGKVLPALNPSILLNRRGGPKGSSSLARTVLGTDDRIRITDTRQSPWNQIGLLEVTFPNGNFYGGTGVLVGPNTVLTAGHVIYSDDDGGWASRVTFTAGRNGRDRWYGEARHTKLISNTAWTNEAAHEHDWGIVQLDRQLGRVLGHFGTTSDTSNVAGQFITTAGYPGDLAPSFTTDSHIYRADGTIDESTNTKLYYKDTLDTFGGQSGSPVWQGNRNIIGIHAYGDSGDGRNSATRIQNYIVDNIRSALSEPAAVDRPDLAHWDNWFNTTIGGFSVGSVSAGLDFSVTTFPRNNGTLPTGNFNVNFYASSDSDVTDSFGRHYLLGSVALGSLTPFDWSTASWSGVFPAIPSGEYKIISFIDPTNSIAEYDDSKESQQLVFPGSLSVRETLPPRFGISSLNASQAEGNIGVKAFTFAVTRSGDVSRSNSVDWAVSGSGINPANEIDFLDNRFPSGNVIFNVGETSKVITINVQSDQTVEPDEGFSVSLSNPSGNASLEADSAVGTIINDDIPDLVAPRLEAVTVTGSTLFIEFDEILNPGSVSTKLFKIGSRRQRIKVLSAQIDSESNIVELTLNSTIRSTASLLYRDPTGDQRSGVIQDLFGNDANRFSSIIVG